MRSIDTGVAGVTAVPNKQGTRVTFSCIHNNVSFALCLIASTEGWKVGRMHSQRSYGTIDDVDEELKAEYPPRIFRRLVYAARNALRHLPDPSDDAGRRKAVEYAEILPESDLLFVKIQQIAEAGLSGWRVVDIHRSKIGEMLKVLVMREISE